ncbi:protein NRT1/ PTR FAMILY 6.2-like [Primulina tabacum]|uniref:protein NRT1/ PTR FAMILY 6.2-like n=1 Tax=Primulina tabacum TaxID=48773 RepID=UPI003F597604
MSSTLASNGCVDYKGRIADKQSGGGWKASPFIIVNEVAERLAFFAIAVSMMPYLAREMHQPVPDAATHITDWIGAAYVLTLLGAFLADSYLGFFLDHHGLFVHLRCSSKDSLRPPHCTKKPCIPASTSQTALFYCALAL